MANQEHLDILKKGVETWNQWRKERAHIQMRWEWEITPGRFSRREILNMSTLFIAEVGPNDLNDADLSDVDLSDADLFDKLVSAIINLTQVNLSEANLSLANLSGADLSEADLFLADLSGANLTLANLTSANLYWADLSTANLGDANLQWADLTGTNLSRANLGDANLQWADLTGTNLSRAQLYGANFRGANLSGADLSLANLSGADLSRAVLSGADLSRAVLDGARLLETNFAEATLTNCHIYGISVWNVQMEGAKQNNLVITPIGEPIITVDNLEVAQFIYLLLNNPKIREVIDTIARKAVLILGRFTPERKAVLEALREALRTHGYLPIVFDFDKPASRDLTETVSTLAHLSHFIIVDLTDPSSAPHEVATVIPQTVVPVQPLLSREPLMVDGKVVERREYAMFQDLKRRYHWVLPTYSYTDQAHLLATLKEHVIAPAEQKAQELAKR